MVRMSLLKSLEIPELSVIVPAFNDEIAPRYSRNKQMERRTVDSSCHCCRPQFQTVQHDCLARHIRHACRLAAPRSGTLFLVDRSSSFRLVTHHRSNSFGTANLLGVGVLGAYLTPIFDEIKRRPEYLVMESLNSHSLQLH